MVDLDVVLHPVSIDYKVVPSLGHHLLFVSLVASLGVTAMFDGNPRPAPSFVVPLSKMPANRLVFTMLLANVGSSPVPRRLTVESPCPFKWFSATS